MTILSGIDGPVRTTTEIDPVLALAPRPGMPNQEVSVVVHSRPRAIFGVHKHLGVTKEVEERIGIGADGIDHVLPDDPYTRKKKNN